MIEVIPAIIPESLGDIEDGVARVTGLVTCVQIDIADGKFAPAPTWPYIRTPDADFDALLKEENGLPEWEQMSYEIDMMVREPEKKIDDFVRIGISTAIFHIESTDRLSEAIEKARYFDIKVGLALNPSTPNEMLDEWMDKIDFVQFMGNDKIGYHGVELDKSMLEKISIFRKKYPQSIIGIDIGVNEETAPELVAAGATRLVSGSAIFDSTDVESAIDFFKNL
jgi:ribulose-phosphate 3-epimerase